MDLINTAAIVTGGASGLGAAVVRALAGRGAQVYALDLPEAISDIPAGIDIHYLAVNVTNVDEVRSAVAKAAAGAPLRTVVNCAGILPTMRILGRKGVHDPDVFEKVIQVNLMGSFNVLTAAADAISKTQPDDHGQRGVVINTASIAAFEGQIGQVAYASSKAAIVGMTLPAARDLAQYGIRVNSIAPGIVETPMMATVSDEIRQTLAANVTFPQRLARPDEFAHLALSIIENDYINGETIRMDGALRMSPQ
ncbi:SDR family NAD(P)-dependent oxidoreductase [Arthrobacter sp. StoSoilB5]|jgi:NAD(P)-dependent dehydrogenase (short-subunit alcohol dehydrogenase family)|uniref:SDR family NAD(P)-dependent oxidoreductase n=1 Tax=Arthrobacter sp. StoSoilB5 TaxID=2830992 RepID=UPI001CC44033|nr:SDR family NAD(P)-dependent oxidoreductase [Arthrobacter sp. StoSoilB5]BCW45345.1 3-hydroxy-2-methylbutyryl-CoA dehydrogenase [Arthrobacter sp. StoSoilB5]